MAVRARDLSVDALSSDLEAPHFTDLEESFDGDVLDVEREMEFFVFPIFPDFVPAERPDTLLPVVLVRPPRDVERIPRVEEKPFSTFRILDLARTLDAFWLVRLFLTALPLIPGCLDDMEIFPKRFVWLRARATLEIRGAWS
jgi:hypothetical protein